MNKSRILVVDDEPNLSSLVRLYLEKTQRFEVRVENRPALALFAAREFRPDMVLLDIDMPGKDGGEVATEIESDPTLRGVPILFLTSLVSTSEAGNHEIERAGRRYLAKPTKPQVLIDAVDRLLAETTPA
ncbi:MAG TPA: response regulator [Chthoniobacterales bacterium]|nr:response regulator [Chthoniobacterales bacterium]